MALSDEDVREILRLIDESELDELRIETAEFKLHVQRAGAAPPETPPSTDGARTITAPMPGTFYRAERPGAKPFVDLGTTVQPETVVGIIEIMKMMNTVEAGVAGTVVEVCAENAQLVKDGAPLFKVV